MAQEQYRVVFLGRFAPGLGREKVVARLDERFRFSEAALGRIVPGNIVVLKRGLDRERAERIVQALSDAGACCRAVSEVPVSEVPVSEVPVSEVPVSEVPVSEVPVSEVPVSEVPVSEVPVMICPKCGQEQAEGEACTFCGIVIAKFRSRQEESAEALFPTEEPAGVERGLAMAGVAAALAGTKPWVRLFAILMFIGAGLGLIGSVITMVVGGSQGAPVGLIAVVQIASCALYVIPAYFLYKYADAIGSYLQGESPADLEVALGYQKSFWKFVGILTAVMMGLALLGIAAAVIIPLMFRG